MPPVATATISARALASRRRVAVVLNAQARQVSPEVVAQARDVVPADDLFISRDLPSARDIARHVVERGYDAVLAGGGDGTFVRCVSDVYQAANRHGRRAPAVGLLRLGTGNALADTLGLAPGTSLETMLSRARVAPEQSFELLSVAGQLTPFAGIGLDAQILADYAAMGRSLEGLHLGVIPKGAARYGLAVGLRTLPRFLFAQQPVVTIVNMGAPAIALDVNGQAVGEPIPAGEVIYSGPVTLASASTITYYGLGLQFFPHARRLSRRFQLRVASCGAAEILAHVPALFRGTFQSPRLHDFACNRVVFYLEAPSTLQVGGDLCGEHRAVTVSLAPRPVRLVA